MSNLVPSILNLDKGLNLQTAKIVATPGTVLDSLNYEQVDFQGQKRIDGYARYDGRLLSAIDEYYAITVSSAATYDAGDLIATEDGLLGVIVGKNVNKLFVAIIDHNLIPDVGDTITHTADAHPPSPVTVTAVALGADDAADADTHYTNLLAFNQVLRDLVEELPGAIIGLHWFRDRLYAVADVLTVSLDGTTPEIFPNDTLVVGGSDTAKVLGSLTLDNTRILFLNSLSADEWATGEDVTRNDTSVGTISEGYETFGVTSEVASFYESRTEAQVLEEDIGPFDFGWRFVDHGWSVQFENGTSAYGSLPSLNQNIDGLGTQGPTNTSGNNGAPLTLSQKVSINDKPAQVNGWKTSDTPTSYNLDPLAIRETDTDYIYADAFFSWDGTTGVVSAPGLTSSTIPEYPADATVVIEL